jgi:hypothetical protein
LPFVNVSGGTRKLLLPQYPPGLMRKELACVDRFCSSLRPLISGEFPSGCQSSSVVEQRTHNSNYSFILESSSIFTSHLGFCFQSQSPFNSLSILLTNPHQSSHIQAGGLHFRVTLNAPDR